MSNDFYDFNTETGAITAKDTSVIKDAVKADLTAALGATDFSASTPMGRLVEWLTIFGANVLKLNMQNSNQLLISAAAGQQLDALALLFGLQRKAATKTTVTATLTGTASITIPSGTRAKSESGDVYELTASVTLDSTGVGTGTFACTEYGKVFCEVGELVYIETPTVGWDSVVNTTAGSTGTELETDDELRTRIQESRYSGIGFLGAMKNAVESVDGVKSSMIIENNTSDAQTIHGVDNVWAHSVFVCVDYTNNTTVENNIAKALFNTKPCGTSYSRLANTEKEAGGGGESRDGILVEDDYGNKYNVYFCKPEEHTVAVYLEVKNRSYSGTDLKGDVKTAITTLWSKATSYKVGETVYASDITRAVEELVPGVLVFRCLVNFSGTNPTTYQNAAYEEIAASAKAVFSASQITVEVKD